MSFIDGVVIPVPQANRAAYLEEVRQLGKLFIDCGADEVVDTWGVDVPDGEVTSFPLAVRCEPDEAVALGWIVWPSREVRDAGWRRRWTIRGWSPRHGPMTASA